MKPLLNHSWDVDYFLGVKDTPQEKEWLVLRSDQLKKVKPLDNHF